MVIVPIDDGLISLSSGLRNLRTKLEQLVAAAPDAILAFLGPLMHCQDVLRNVPLILNITASTAHTHHTQKVIVGTIWQALKLDADAVAVHVNVTSRHEPEMLSTLGKVSRDCDDNGMPLLAIMYPRSEDPTGDSDNNYLELRETDSAKYADLVAHAARIGVELGASLVKTQYTGHVETFARVVEACRPVPVVVAGGPVKPVRSILQVAHDAVAAGGAGVSFGRNIFERSDALLLNAIKALVHGSDSVDEVMHRFFDKDSVEEADDGGTNHN